MMYPCKQCGDNAWDYNKVDCLIYATCRNCGYEVSFETKKSRKASKNLSTETEITPLTGFVDVIR